MDVDVQEKSGIWGHIFQIFHSINIILLFYEWSCTGTDFHDGLILINAFYQAVLEQQDIKHHCNLPNQNIILHPTGIPPSQHSAQYQLVSFV